MDAEECGMRRSRPLPSLARRRKLLNRFLQIVRCGDTWHFAPQRFEASGPPLGTALSVVLYGGHTRLDIGPRDPGSVQFLPKRLTCCRFRSRDLVANKKIFNAPLGSLARICDLFPLHGGESLLLFTRRIDKRPSFLSPRAQQWGPIYSSVSSACGGGRGVSAELRGSRVAPRRRKRCLTSLRN